MKRRVKKRALIVEAAGQNIVCLREKEALMKKIKFFAGIDFGDRAEKRLLEWSWPVLRVIAALLMLTHGFGKLMGFSGIAPNFPDPLGVGSSVSLALVVFSEFFGSVFVALGLFTRAAAFTIFFTMMVAGLVVHAPDPFKEKELALVYALIFLVLTAAGGGKLSLDSWLRRKL